MKSMVFILGTRPEAIKLAPLILLAKENQNLRVEVVLTSQHPEMCKGTLEEFGLVPTKILASFENGQGLLMLSSRILSELTKLDIEWSNSLVIVQGDTTSALMGAYAGFLLDSKVAHIEAGLRSHDHLPFPEEMNRRLISSLATFNFCATPANEQNLRIEGIDEDKIFVVGNTVIDAMLHFGVASRELKTVKSILITLHRRENQGEVIRSATAIISNLANTYNAGYKWIFIKHPNPSVQNSYNSDFLKNQNIEFRDPIPYPNMLEELKSASLLITDSGGFQEEATFLGLPTLVLRRTTERREAIEERCCLLVPNPQEDLEKLVINLLKNNDGIYDQMSHPSNVFGMGNSAAAVLETLAGFEFGSAKW